MRYKIVPSKSQSDDGVKFTDKYFKQNEINPSTKLKSNIINEGRYDSISRQLASYTLKGWKDDFEHNEPTGRVEFAVGPDGDLEYEDLKFSYKGVAVFAGIQTYSYNGSARLTSGEIKITYSIPKSMLPQGWEKIYMDLISVIRHEIEHLTQSGANVKPGKEIDSDTKDSSGFQVSIKDSFTNCLANSFKPKRSFSFILVVDFKVLANCKAL